MSDRSGENGLWSDWESLLWSSGVLAIKVGLLDPPAEGQQVAVALDPVHQLCVGQLGGQYGEEVTKHQRVQFGWTANTRKEMKIWG